MKMYVLTKSMDGIKSVGYLLAQKEKENSAARLTREEMKGITCDYVNDLTRLFILRYSDKDPGHEIWRKSREKGQKFFDALMEKLLDRIPMHEYLAVINHHTAPYDLKFFQNVEEIHGVEQAFKDRARKKLQREILCMVSKNLSQIGMIGAVAAGIVAAVTGFSRDNVIVLVFSIVLGTFFHYVSKDFDSLFGTSCPQGHRLDEKSELIG